MNGLHFKLHVLETVLRSTNKANKQHMELSNLIDQSFIFPNSSTAIRLPHQKRHHLNPAARSILFHIKHHFIDRRPPVLQIQRQAVRRRFDVRLCARSVRIVETGADEHGAQTTTLVGGVDGEDVEDWWM